MIIKIEKPEPPHCSGDIKLSFEAKDTVDHKVVAWIRQTASVIERLREEQRYDRFFYDYLVAYMTTFEICRRLAHRHIIKSFELEAHPSIEPRVSMRPMPIDELPTIEETIEISSASCEGALQTIAGNRFLETLTRHDENKVGPEMPLHLEILKLAGISLIIENA